MIDFLRYWMILILSGIPGITVQAQTLAPSNMDILKTLFIRPVGQAIDSSKTELPGIKIEFRAQNELSQWVQEQIQSDLLHKNLTVYSAENTTGNWDLKVVIDNLENQVFYRGKDRDLLLRYVTYHREIYTILSFHIRTADETIINSFSKNSHYADVVSRSEIQGIENKFYPFSKGITSQDNYLKKVLEPGLVTAATIGVVYLFFSLRSK